ncbi:flagellar assembly protein FliW [Pelagirhabdus alkalitolerans]
MIDINSEHIIEFPQGIPGFQEEKSFVILNLEDASAFQILQSTQTENLAFIIINPFSFVPDYQIELDQATLEQLNIEKQEDVKLVNIVTLHDTLESSTVNLKAPLVINQTLKLAKQYVIKNDLYSTKDFVFQSTPEKEDN